MVIFVDGKRGVQCFIFSLEYDYGKEEVQG